MRVSSDANSIIPTCNVAPGDVRSPGRPETGFYSYLTKPEVPIQFDIAQIAVLLARYYPEQFASIGRPEFSSNELEICNWLHRTWIPLVQYLHAKQIDLCVPRKAIARRNLDIPAPKRGAFSAHSGLISTVVAELTEGRIVIKEEQRGRTTEQIQTMLSSVLQVALDAAIMCIAPRPGLASSGNMRHAIQDAVGLWLQKGGDHQWRKPERRAASAARFEAILQSSLGTSLTIPELARKVGVSGRTLHTICQEQFGMSPQRVLALRRLQRIHLELVSSNRKSTTVTKVAMSFGVLELGRFARTYRSVYGQLPSMTLRRSPEFGSRA